MKHYDIVIATPGRAMEAEYVRSLVETLEWLTSKGMNYKFLNKYSSMVSSAREKTAINSDLHMWDETEIAGGEFTYDYLLWVDSDVVWTPLDLERLIKSDKEIVSACVPVNLEGDVAAYRLGEQGYAERLHWNDFALEYEPVAVDGVGFGMLLVKYGVFEGIKRPWFEHEKLQVIGQRSVMAGEDYSWCMKARRAGFDIYIHPGVSVGHCKDIVMRF